MMNSTTSDTLQQILVGFFVAPGVLIAPFVSLFLFPFYVSVNRTCRSRDSKSSIFPFVAHFFWITCFNQILFPITFPFAMAFTIVVWSSNNWFVTSILFVPLVIYALFLIVASYVCNILTILLSLHRFVLYYFPNVGNKVTPSRGTANILIGLIYIAVTCLGCIEAFNVNMKSTKTEWFLKFHIVVDIFLVLATIPYFLMIKSIRKLSYLISNTQSKPEEYIKYQIIIIVLRKLSNGMTILACRMYEDDGFQEALLFSFIEGISTFLSIQISYLLTNRANVEALLKMKISVKTLKYVLFGVSAEVKPMVSTISSSRQ